MSDGLSAVYQLFERINSYFQMSTHKITGYTLIALGSLYAIGNHWLIADQQKRTCWNFIIKTNGKNSSRFHINRIGPDLFQIFFKNIIMFPDPSVRCIYGSRPIVYPKFTNGGGNRFLQCKGGQCGNFRRKIIIGCSFSRVSRQSVIPGLPVYFFFLVLRIYQETKLLWV